MYRIKSNRGALVILAALAGVGILAVALAPGHDAAHAAPLGAIDDNLISCWDLDEASGIRYDETANSYDLTDNNTVGQSGGFADFDDLNSEYLSHADNSDFDVGGQDFSVVVWVDLDDTAGAKNFIGKWEPGGGNEEWHLFYHGGADRLRFGINNGSAQNIDYDAVGAPSPDTYYFLAAGVDETTDNEQWFRVDDGATLTNAQNNITSGTAPLLIGADDTGTDDFMDGQIKYAAFWKRELTSGELDWLFNSGAGRPCSEIVAGEATATPTPTNTPTETPTATPTNTPTGTLLPTSTGVPAYVIQSTLPSGNEFIIERSATFGEIINGGVLMAVGGLLLIISLMQIAKF